MVVNELKRGQYFMLADDEREVYEYVKMTDANSCEIKSVAFKMDGIWHPRSVHTTHSCNPYVIAKIVKFSVD